MEVMHAERMISDITNRPPEWIAKDAFYIYERQLDRYTEGVGGDTFVCTCGDYQIELEGSAYDPEGKGANLRVLDASGTCVVSAVCKNDYKGEDLPTEMIISDVCITTSMIEPVGQALMSPLEKAALVAQSLLPEGVEGHQAQSSGLLYQREVGAMSRVLIFASSPLVSQGFTDPETIKSIEQKPWHFIAQQWDDGTMMGSPYYEIPAVEQAINRDFGLVLQAVQLSQGRSQVVEIQPAKLPDKGAAFVTSFQDGGCCVFGKAATELAQALEHPYEQTRQGKPMLKLRVSPDLPQPLGTALEGLQKLGYSPQVQPYEKVVAAVSRPQPVKRTGGRD